MPGIKPVISGHFEMFFRDMLNQEFDEINGRKGSYHKRIIFVFVVVESDIFPIVGINPGKGDGRTAKIAADIFDNGVGVTKIRFGINVKTVFVLAVYFSLCLFKGGTNPIFQFTQQDSLKGFTEVRIIEIFYSAPKTIVRIPAFRKKAMDMWVPFQRAAEGMEDTDKTGDKVFGFVQGIKKFPEDIRNSLKEAVKQVTVFEEKRAEGFVNGEDEVPVGTVDQFEGHGSRPVIGIFSTTGRAELGMTTERNKFKCSTMRASIHGTAIRRIAAVDYFFDVFHNNRSGL